MPIGVLGFGLLRAFVVLVTAVMLSIAACLTASRIARRGGHSFEFTDAVIFGLLGGGAAGLLGPAIARLVVATPREVTLPEHWNLGSVAGSVVAGLAIGGIVGTLLGIGAAADGVTRDRAPAARP